MVLKEIQDHLVLFGTSILACLKDQVYVILGVDTVNSRFLFLCTVLWLCGIIEREIAKSRIFCYNHPSHWLHFKTRKRRGVHIVSEGIGDTGIQILS